MLLITKKAAKAAFFMTYLISLPIRQFVSFCLVFVWLYGAISLAEIGIGFSALDN